MKRKIFGILFALVLALGLSLVTAVPVSAAITNVTNVPTDSTAGATTTHTVAFTTGAPLALLAPTDQIIITFPAGFDASGAGVDGTTTTPSGSDPTLSATTTVVTLTVTLDEAAGAFSIVLTGIDNHQTAGSYTVDVETQDGLGVTIEGPAPSAAFNITAGPANQLVITQQPAAGANSGAVLGMQPIVEAQDQFTNKDTTFIETVTITADVGALSGDVDITAVDGVATFTDLVHTASADNQVTTLTANDEDGVGTDLPTVDANAFTTLVIATQLVFTQQPAGSVSGVALVTQPIVEAQDANNMKDTDYVTDVVASEDDAGTLAGTLTVTPVEGVATFTDLVYTATANGEIFQINVADGGLTPATSADVVCYIITAWGGGWAPPTPTIETNLFGKVSRFRFHITTRGEIREMIQATSGDGMLTMTIPKGTIALDKNGKPLSTLTSDVDPSPPPPPSHIIGLAYDFGPNGATFDPAITLTWSYDPDALPEGVAEENLVVAYYDEGKGEWVDLPTTVDPVTHTITVSVSHFTTFALIAHAAPAAFSTSNLSIQPSEVQPEEAVTITLSVANTGGTEGSYAVVLKINDVKETEKSVTVDAGASKEVTFTTAKDVAGSYSVDVNGLSGSFTVKEKPAPTPAPPPAPPPEVTPPFNWPLVGGIIGAVIVVGLLIFFLVVRRRAH